MGGNSVSGFQAAFVLLGSMLLLFIIAPLVRLVISTPGQDIANAWSDQELMSSIWLTLRCSGMATVICLMFGVPLAYLLARGKFALKPVLQGIVDLPIMVPHSAAGIALLAILGRNSLAQRIAEPAGLRFVGEEAGITVAMAFVSIPFLVNSARQGFEAVPERMENVARTLGVSRWQAFLSIALPLSWRAILSGMVLMWGRGISEFGAVLIIAYYPMTTPVLVYQRFNDYGLAHSRSAAVALILVCVVIFAGLRLIAQPRKAERI